MPEGIEVLVLFYLVILTLLGILGEHAAASWGWIPVMVLIGAVMVFTFLLAYLVHFLGRDL